MRAKRVRNAINLGLLGWTALVLYVMVMKECVL